MTHDVSQWPIALATVGNGLLIGALALGATGLQRRSERQTERRAEKREAYTRFIAAVGPFVLMAGALRLAAELRSGLTEGLEVLLHLRPPADPLAIHDFARPDYDRVHDAWAAVWAVGSAEAVKLGNDLMLCVGDVMSASTSPAPGRQGWRRFLAGVSWGADDLERIDEAIRRLAEVRRQFTHMARAELGSEVVDVFTGAAAA